MNSQTSNQFIYKDSNVIRSVGLLFLAISLLFILLTKWESLSTGVMSIERIMIGLLVTISLTMILFSGNLTVIADKSSRVLHMRYSFVLFRRTRNIPFDGIADIQSQASVNTRKAKTRGYRLVAVLRDGAVVPFRKYFTRHDNKKEAAVNLRLAITGSRHSEVDVVEAARASLTI